MAQGKLELEPQSPVFPATRYQGSKSRWLPWLRGLFETLSFDSALDMFSGTASVSFVLKSLGKRVHSNDALASNFLVARALVENSHVRLPPAKAHELFSRAEGRHYGRFISQTFEGIYFLPEENAWLDLVAENVAAIEDPYESSLAYFALFQACLKKRPFNLFHRKNLALRTNVVERTFGNKRTWDAPFEAHFLQALQEANEAIFDSGQPCVATRGDALTLEAKADLVYLDPPYMNARGISVDYLEFYHFLEGLTDLKNWGGRVDGARAHRPFQRSRSPFSSRAAIGDALDSIFERHRQSIIAVSYRSDGIPTSAEIGALLKRHKKKVNLYRAGCRYAALVAAHRGASLRRRVKGFFGRHRA